MRNLMLVGAVAVALGVGVTVLWVGGADDSAVENAAHTRDAHEGAERWTCEMHPEVVQSEAGVCPVCNMTLVPLTAEARPPADVDESTGDSEPPSRE